MPDAAKSTWSLAQLGELAADEDGSIAIGPFGSSMKAEVYTSDGIPVVRGNNLGDRPGFRGEFVYVDEATAARFPRCMARPGDLVFPHRGAIGEVGLVTGPNGNRWMISTSMMKFRPHPAKLDALYVYYFFKSPAGRHQLLRNTSQVGTPGIGQPLTSLRACEVPVPPISEQHAIAGVLGALDDKIESNRRTSRALERLARAIFRAWFVDFEPVKAKAAGARSFLGMSQEAFDTLPARLVESELGPVPEGWDVTPIDEAMEVNPSYRLPKGISAPYLDMAQMPTDGHAPATWSKREAGSGARFMNGDTLVARITPCLENGKTAFVDFLEEGQVAWGSTEYIVLRPKSPIPDLYAYLLARTPEFRAFAIQNMTGTSGRQRVPFSTMSKFSVTVGPATVMVAFGEVVEPLFSRSSAGFRESRSLATLRDYLLPKLLSGEIRARER